MKRILFLLLFSASSFSVYSQGIPRIAVLPFNPIGVSEQESHIFTELFETGLVRTEAFQIIEQNRMKEIIEAQKYSLEGCTDEVCAVEVGRLVAADRIVLGTISAVGDQYVINAKIINVETGENIKADNVTAQSIEKLMNKVDLLAFKLAGLTYTKGAEEQIAKEFGDVFITTIPAGADIYINGINKGTSPELFRRVPLGTVRIEARKGNLYGRKLVDITAGIGEITIKLQELLGHLFIKSNKQDLTVYLDGKRLGGLGDGFFKNLPIGSFTLELIGPGLYWSGKIDIAADESTRIEANVNPVGGIKYVLPNEAKAEIKGTHFQEIVAGSGELNNVWTGKYRITITGEPYETSVLAVTIQQNQTVILDPKLVYTVQYLEDQTEKIIKEMSSLLDMGKRLTRTHISEIESFRQKLDNSEHEIAYLTTKISALLEKAYASYFTRKVEEVSIVLGSLYTVTEKDLATISTLLEEVNACPFDYPSLEEQVSNIQFVASKKYTLKELMNDKNDLQLRIRQINKKRKGRTIGSFVTLGAGVVGGGLFGLFQLLAAKTYDQYQAATTTTEVIAKRDQYQSMETLSFVSAGVGGAGLGVSAVLWLTRPKTDKYEKELAQIHKQIAIIRGELE